MMKVAMYFFILCVALLLSYGCGSGRNREEKLASTTEGLIKQLSSSPSWYTRSRAASALGEKGPAAAKAVPALTRALDDKQQDVRSRAAWALGEIGSAAVPAKPALIRSLAKYEEYEFPRVGEALIKIGLTESETDTVVSILREALVQARHFHQKADAAEMLGDLGPAASDAVPDLVQALHMTGDTDRDVCDSAIYALGDIGQKSTVPQIAEFLYDKDDSVSFAATIAIAKLTGKRSNTQKLKDWWKAEGRYMEWNDQEAVSTNEPSE